MASTISTGPDSIARVYLVRHGETTWSLTGQHTGRTDIPLTEHGEQEATAVGELMQGVSFARVLSSPAQRAQRTGALADPARTAMIDPDLAEWDYGDDEGLRTVEVQRDRPGWNVFRDGCPGGESPTQVGARADRLIRRLRTARGNVAAYSHGQFGAVLAARWIGLSVADAQHLQLDAASLSVLGWEPGHADVPVIALWNETPRAQRRPDPATTGHLDLAGASS